MVKMHSLSQSHKQVSRTNSNAHGRTLFTPVSVSDSHLPGISRRVDGSSITNAQPQPPSSSSLTKASEIPRLQQRYPSFTLPRKPSWSAPVTGRTNTSSHSQSTHENLTTEPVPPTAVALSLGDSGSARVPELSTRERKTLGIEDGTQTQHIYSKREREVEARESGAPTSRRRRRRNTLESEDRLNDDRQKKRRRLPRKVSDLDRTLLDEKMEVSLLRQELDEERRKRVRAELIVEDIRREMKEPFIVPILLDAFIKFTSSLDNCMEGLPA